MTTASSSGARAAILESATAHFAQDGYAKTSMDQIRRAAGVSNGSLFHFFPTKADLARAVYLDAMRDFQSYLYRAIASDPPAEEGVKKLLEGYFRWIAERPDHARILHGLRHTEAVQEAAGEIAGVNAEGYDALKRWVAARTELGEMRKVPFSVWVALVLAPVLWMTQSSMRKEPPKTPAATRAALIAGAWAAVAANP